MAGKWPSQAGLDKRSFREHENRMSETLPPPPGMTSDDKLWAVFCHLSVLFGVGLLLPLIVWLVKKDESPGVAAHAREALNFHISLYIYGFVSAVLIFFCIGYFLLMGLALFGLVCAILAAIEASKGGFFRYPLTIPLIR